MKSQFYSGHFPEDNTFFTSDTHFFHKNILKYCKNRGDVWKTVEEMNEGLRERWNAFVPKDGVVFMLGDVLFGYKYKEMIPFLNSFNGTKHLIYGNHDQTIQKNDMHFLRRTGNVDGKWKKVGVYDSIQDYKEINVGRQHICLFHFAPRVWNKAHRGSWCLWGHSHGGLEPFGKSVDVGIDSPWILEDLSSPPMRPFSFQEIKAFMDKQTVIDHHGEA